MVKHALVAKKKLWDKIIKTDFEKLLWEEIITTSIEIKNSIVLSDPFEKGDRGKLNFGHTFGHAIESYYLKKGSPILHGEAIFMGMILETELSSLSTEKKLEIKNFILSDFPIPHIPKKSDLLPFLRNDKKNKNGKISFSLLTEIGKCSVNNLFSYNEL